MAITQILRVGPGDDLFRIAARMYRDAEAWSLLDRANPQLNGDPIISAAMTLNIPAYSVYRANGGIGDPGVPLPAFPLFVS